jgi:hypothetical protein
MSRITRRLILAAAGCLLLAAAPAATHAQGFRVDLYGGGAFPTGSLHDLTRVGFSGGLGFGYLFTRRVGVRADFAAEWLSAEPPVGSPPDDVDENILGRDINLYHYDASIVINATDPRRTNWHVAIDAGAGVTTIQFRGDETDRPDAATRFSVPVGIAFGYRVAETIDVFVRGRWYLVFTDQSRFGGTTWASFPIWAGFGIRAG